VRRVRATVEKAPALTNREGWRVWVDAPWPLRLNCVHHGQVSEEVEVAGSGRGDLVSNGLPNHLGRIGDDLASDEAADNGAQRRGRIENETNVTGVDRWSPGAKLPLLRAMGVLVTNVREVSAGSARATHRRRQLSRARCALLVGRR